MRAIAQHHTNQNHHHQTAHQHLIDAVILLCAKILAGEAERSLVQRIHRSVNKALNVACRGVARNHNGAERVDRRLNQHIRDIENHALQTGRQADLHNAGKFIPMEVQPLEIDVAHAVHAHQA